MARGGGAEAMAGAVHHGSTIRPLFSRCGLNGNFRLKRGQSSSLLYRDPAHQEDSEDP
jgi:hypothetical protein